jgi:CRISPR-associated protein Csx17
MAAPFMVNASGVGYASAAETDPGTSRHELWLPVWERPATLRELRQLLSEGRAKVAQRNVRNGIDFALAISSLGVDRGISGFHRYGFHRRNGLAYFATPLGRIRVGMSPNVDLIAPLDRWLQTARRGAASDLVPASIRRAIRQLDAAILNVAIQRASGVEEVLVALGRVDGALSRSKNHEIPPVPTLPNAWIDRADDGSPEFDLAASLASTGIRGRLVRWSANDPYHWQEQADCGMVWGERSLDSNLVALVRRIEVEDSQLNSQAGGSPKRAASLRAIDAFLLRETDDTRLEALLRGLSLVAPEPRHRVGDQLNRFAGQCCYAYAVAKLIIDRTPIPGIILPQTPGLVAKLARGDVAGAVALASRRLRGAGLKARTSVIHEPSSRGLRIAAALSFPLEQRAHFELARQVLVPATSALNPTSN